MTADRGFKPTNIAHSNLLQPDRSAILLHSRVEQLIRFSLSMVGGLCSLLKEIS